MKTVWFTSLLMMLLADKPAYLLYDRHLKATDYASLLRQAGQADVVLFGELHNNPVCHWLQRELAGDLLADGRKMVLGAEMFEADNQLVLDEYLNGTINAQQLEAEAKVWPNFRTDYKPLVDFARENRLPFVATNIPRRYAGVVARKGLGELENLSPEARKSIAPLPVEVDLQLPGYAALLKMGGPHGSAMSGENMARAQAVKDATMACFILKNRKPGSVFLHVNGSYHSEHFEGISWYLRKAEPSLKIVTIATTEEKNIAAPAEAKPDLADFVLTVPESMTKTH